MEERLTEQNSRVESDRVLFICVNYCEAEDTEICIRFV